MIYDYERINRKKQRGDRQEMILMAELFGVGRAN
jgi:hypothetical protein